MNVYTWTIGASHTPAAFLAVAGTALPFDLTDTLASLFFGFAFGPELARLLARMRARMDVSWEAVEAPASRLTAARSGARAPSARGAAPVARRRCSPGTLRLGASASGPRARVAERPSSPS